MKSALAVLLGAILIFSAHIALGQEFTLEWVVEGVAWYFEDMDGDNVGEFAVSEGDTVRFYDGANHNLKWTANGCIRQMWFTTSWMPFSVPPAVDFNGDGVKDVLLAGYESDTVLRIADVANDSTIFDLSDPTVYHVEFRYLADVDGDDELELVILKLGEPFGSWESTYVYGTGVPTTALERASSGSPVMYKLNQNYPNPFRNSPTRINYSLQREGRASIRIYNSAGQSVKSLVDENKKKGEHVVDWDGTDDGGHRVSSGVYFYQLQVDNHKSSRKAILVR